MRSLIPASSTISAESVISLLIHACGMISADIGDVSFWPCLQQGMCCHDRLHSFSYTQYSLSLFTIRTNSRSQNKQLYKSKSGTKLTHTPYWSVSD
jgi:hypothetical protein